MEGVVPMVSCSSGSINSLLQKLAELMKTSGIPGLPRDNVEGLLEALKGLSGGFVDKVARRQEADLQVREWMKQVRQLVVDIEDWLDPQLRTASKDEPENENSQDVITNDDFFEDFMTQIGEACERCTRYGLLNKSPTGPAKLDVLHSNVTIESRRLHLGEKPADPVGVDGPIEAIIKKLTDGKKSLKVVSLVGMDGTGKTTLAKKINVKLQGNFDCQAFVSVGRRTTVRTTVMDILLKVKKWVSHDTQAITDLREWLHGKRYLIIIDGVRSTCDWKVINCALPDNNCGSRVLTTTCIMSVAKSCSGHPSDIHQMKALTRDHSKEIFDGECAFIHQMKALSRVNFKEIFVGESDVVHEMKALSEIDSKEIFGGESTVVPRMKALTRVDSKNILRGESTVARQMKSFRGVNSKEIFGGKTTAVPQIKALSGVDTNEIFCGQSTVVSEMKTLRGVGSKEIFGGEPQRLIVENMLKMCDGMPLAIIVAAGLSYRRSAQLAQPKMFGRSDSTSEGMTNILYMSYNDLSVPLKSCFMYLSVFPENFTIEKDRLMRLWQAEGFIPRSHEESMLETGERYFNELISRRLIQPVCYYEDDQAVACTIHGVVLDFIASLSREENFVTLGVTLKYKPELSWSLMAPVGAESTSSRPYLFYETVRRLSLQCHGDNEGGNLVSCHVHLSRVRTLIAFGSSVCSVHLPDLKEFKLIRVLDLEGSKSEIIYSTIGNLFLLRYLGLAGTNIVRQDMQYIRGLDHLQTLDIRKTSVNELPFGVHLRPNLVSLLCDGMRFTCGSSGSLNESGKNLEELSTIDISDRTTRDAVAKLLTRSEKLRMLGVRIGVSGSNTEDVIPFLDELRQYNLESLVIESLIYCSLNEWVPSPKLQRFQLHQLIPRVPESWASLERLTHLDLRTSEIDAGGFLVIGKLPKLIFLKLCSSAWSVGIVSSIGFQSLEVASLEWSLGGMLLCFEDGAMPKLRKLRILFDAGKTKHATSKFPSDLTQVDVVISCINSTPADVEYVQRAIRKQISDHPRKPNLSFHLRHAGVQYLLKKKSLDHKESSSALGPSPSS